MLCAVARSSSMCNLRSLCMFLVVTAVSAAVYDLLGVVQTAYRTTPLDKLIVLLSFFLKQKAHQKFDLRRCSVHQCPAHWWASESSHYAGAVFGLLGAKMVHDTRHQRLSVFHQSKLQMTTYNAATGETVTGLYGPISEELSYVDCASHIVCAAAACVMPTHVW